MRSLSFLLILLSSIETRTILRGGPPRFRHNVRTEHNVYLGDSIKFKCGAIGRPPPKVHWYRNGHYLDYEALSRSRRIKESRATLDIRRVEVGDRGGWACKVWNSEGQIWRNFTLDIIDFCDYFLPDRFPSSKVPERCLCIWFLTGESKRAGVDWSKIDNSRCAAYSSEPELSGRRPTFDDCFLPPCTPRKHVELTPRKPLCDDGETLAGVSVVADPVLLLDWINEHDMRQVRFLLPELFDDSRLDDLETKLANWTFIEDETRRRIEANSILRILPVGDDPRAGADRSMGSTTKGPFRLAAPLVSPYFRTKDSDYQSTIVQPSGKTLRLRCTAGGKPEPQVAWDKDGNVLTSATVRSVGGSYRIRKWSIELEDPSVSDSGVYSCECSFWVFNSVGSIKRDFHVIIVNRLRSAPIIIPNVLLNQTVRVNSTATFRCRVLSDLIPFLIWVCFQ